MHAEVTSGGGYPPLGVPPSSPRPAGGGRHRMAGSSCTPRWQDSWGDGSFLSLVRPKCARVCGVLGHLAPVHQGARLVRGFACAVSWGTWLLFTGVPARCVVLLVRCPGPLGSLSPMCPRGLLCCVCGVLDHLAPAHRCAHFMCCFVCAVFRATWLLFTGVPARCVALRVRCPGPLGSCDRCACSVCCFACAVS